MAVCVVALASLVTGCAVATDEHARRVDTRVDDVFVPVIDPERATEPAERTEVVVWLVGGTVLEPSTRQIDIDRQSVSTAELVSATLGELFEGPRARDAAAGLRSALPPGTELLGVALAGRVATVEVSSEITRVGGADEVRAIAQIVLTASEVPGVGRVRFVVGEDRIQVPLGSGALTSRAVGPEDYRELIAR